MCECLFSIAFRNRLRICVFALPVLWFFVFLYGFAFALFFRSYLFISLSLQVFCCSSQSFQFSFSLVLYHLHCFRNSVLFSCVIRLLVMFFLCLTSLAVVCLLGLTQRFIFISNNLNDKELIPHPLLQCVAIERGPATDIVTPSFASLTLTYT